jgi:hypothetical protein
MNLAKLVLAVLHLSGTACSCKLPIDRTQHALGQIYCKGPALLAEYVAAAAYPTQH